MNAGYFIFMRIVRLPIVFISNDADWRWTVVNTSAWQRGLPHCVALVL